MTKDIIEFNKGDLVQLRSRDSKLKNFRNIYQNMGIILCIEKSRREEGFICHVYFSQIDSTKKIYARRLKKISS